MKIVRFTAENFKRLRAVQITPDGATVTLAGRNAQGKSSILDAIWMALGGGPAAKNTPRPVREGEDHATVTLDLGDFTVERTWTAEGKTALRVTSADGARYPSPQSMLDGLVGRLSFDPLGFAAMSERDQRTALLDLVDLPFDLTELDDERQQVFDKRTDVNRDVKRLEAQLAGMPEPAEDTPAEPVNVADLMDQLRAEQDIDRAHDEAVDAFERAQQTHRDATRRVHELQEQLELAQADELAAEEAAEQADAAVMTHPPSERLAEIEKRITAADDINAAVRAAQDRRRVAAELDTARSASREYSNHLEKIDKAKRDGLAAANMPIDGLSIDETGVTYQGVPFAQASSAEQLRVSLAMAMALNPTIRVIRITDGSLLDSTNLALIEQMATDHDYQVWIEVVDESGQVGVTIEDGQVA